MALPVGEGRVARISSQPVACRSGQRYRPICLRIRWLFLVDYLKRRLERQWPEYGRRFEDRAVRSGVEASSRPIETAEFLRIPRRRHSDCAQRRGAHSSCAEFKLRRSREPFVERLRCTCSKWGTVRIACQRGAWQVSLVGLMLGHLFGEPVANVGFCQKVLRIPRIVFNLLAQLADEGPKVLEFVAVLWSPD